MENQRITLEDINRLQTQMDRIADNLVRIATDLDTLGTRLNGIRAEITSGSKVPPHLERFK